MATCFLNNVYCCYLPAHCSHGLQPLDNGPFNASKAAYRKELQKLTSLTDSAPVDKVNFIRAYAKAREVGMTKKNILSGWQVTGNWPVSHGKHSYTQRFSQTRRKLHLHQIARATGNATLITPSMDHSETLVNVMLRHEIGTKRCNNVEHFMFTVSCPYKWSWFLFL